MQGKHIYGKLNRKQEIALIKDFIILKNNLAEISSDSYEKIDLIKDMKQMQSTCTADYEKKYAQKILYDFKNISKLNSSKYVLCHNDLNRDNILFDEDGNGQIKANFIDWEGLDLCPKEYQFATFLTSSFLIEGYKADETMKFAKILDKDVDEDFLSYLMQIRVFKGLHFFAEARNKYTKSNEEASKEILIKYYNAAEGLQKYREDRGFDKETKKNEMKFLVDFERE